MIYTKQNFTDGSILFAENLEKIENAIISHNFDPMNYDIAVLSLNGSLSGISKNNPVTLEYHYYGFNQGDDFYNIYSVPLPALTNRGREAERYGTCTLKWQGSSSLSYPKKNYTINFDNAFEAKQGWGSQTKYCLKANYVDPSHLRNLVSQRLWARIVQCRPSTDTYGSNFKSAPFYGAVDGFPLALLINGEFQGLYTFNIPKDKWLFGEPKAILCADVNTPGLATSFKTLADFENDFKVEYMDEANGVTREAVLASVNTMIQSVINCTYNDSPWTKCGNYIDIHSAIDYYIHTADECAKDAVLKNYILVTYDMQRWFFSAYDRDTTYGIEYHGLINYPPYQWVTFESYAASHKLMDLILHCNETKSILRQRFDNMHNTPQYKTYDDVYLAFILLGSTIPSRILEEDRKLWGRLPSTNTSDIAIMLEYYRRRQEYLNAEMDRLIPQTTA